MRQGQSLPPSESFISQISFLAERGELGWREMDCVGINTVWGLSRKLCQSVAGSFITGLGSEQSAVWLLWFIQNSCQGGSNHSASIIWWHSAKTDKDLFILSSLLEMNVLPDEPQILQPFSERKEWRAGKRDFRGEEKTGRARRGIPGRHQPLLVASQ